MVEDGGPGICLRCFPSPSVSYDPASAETPSPWAAIEASLKAIHEDVAEIKAMLKGKPYNKDGTPRR
jgi:hypothetical protein